MATNIVDEPDLGERLKLSSQEQSEDERYIDEEEELDRALEQIKNSGKFFIAMYARMMGRY
eukprot:jgi/Orpsp1_1/1186685/evm.model.d7180000052497.1